VETFQVCHSFLNQDEEDDFALYYIENCYWINYFGDAKENIIQYAVSYREKHPGERLKIFFFPPSITGIFYFMDDYDPRFGDTFYDCSWMEGFGHAEALSKINCPSVLIHTNWQYDENGILMGAMNGEDAERAHSLIENNVLINVDSGHSFSWEKPDDFIEIMIDFLNEI
jgi:pimeloyl-ACP methyl ester carboxylesterase